MFNAIIFFQNSRIWYSYFIGLLRGGVQGEVVIPLIFPKVPQSSPGILRVPQLPPPLEHPPLKNPTMKWIMVVKKTGPPENKKNKLTVLLTPDLSESSTFILGEYWRLCNGSFIPKNTAVSRSETKKYSQGWIDFTMNRVNCFWVLCDQTRVLIAILNKAPVIFRTGTFLLQIQARHVIFPQGHLQYKSQEVHMFFCNRSRDTH